MLVGDSTHITHSMELFSVNYFCAIVSAAGYTYNNPVIDNESVDIQINGRIKDEVYTTQRLEVQLKATKTAKINNNSFSFPLKIKNYDDLRDLNCYTPKILIVLLLPNNQQDWLYSNKNFCLLNYGMYWADLRGMLPTQNDNTVSIHINCNNIFNIETVRLMMHSLARTGDIK